MTHLPEVAALLTDDDRSVRCAAAESVGQLCAASISNDALTPRGGRRGGPSDDAYASRLAGLVCDKDALVRAAAAKAIGLSGRGKMHAVQLVAMLRDTDSDPRAAAADALAATCPGQLMETLVHSDVQVRLAAVEGLGRLSTQGDASVASAVAHRLKDAEGAVQWAATKALAQLGSVGADAAAATVGTSEASAVRNLAMDALVGCGPCALPRLTAMLSDKEVVVRLAAVEVLGRLGPVAAPCAEAVAEALRDMDFQVQLAAKTSLPKLGTAGITAAAKLLTDKSRAVRRAAAEIMSCAGSTSKDHLTNMLPFLDDSDGRLRAAAVSTLSSAGPLAESQVQSIANLLDDPDVVVRAAVVRALGTLGPEIGDAYVDGIAGLLGSKMMEMRLAAAEALGKLGLAAQKHQHAIIGLLQDASWQIRMVAVEALGQLGSDAASAVAACDGLENDPNVLVREALAKAVGAAGQAGVSRVASLMQDADPRVRCAAVTSASRISKAAAAPDETFLLDLMRLAQSAAALLVDKDPSVASAAAHSIAKMHLMGHFGYEAMKELVEKDGASRSLALKSLSLLSEPSGIVNLKAEAASLAASQLTDANADVRVAMLEILGQLEDSAASHAGVVAARLEDEDHNVRLAAAEALGHLGDKGLLLAIARLQHNDWRVRSAALCTIQTACVSAMGQRAGAELAELIRDRNAGAKPAEHSPSDLAAVELSSQHHLSQAARADHDTSVRQAAAQALGVIGEPGVLDAKRLLCDKDPLVKAAAAEALGIMGKAGCDHVEEVAGLLQPSSKEAVELSQGHVETADEHHPAQPEITAPAGPKPPGRPSRPVR
eukprot:gnl/MRDRNA2_/MRDRNA2_78689_c0_seq1.p1 gnl/MRDRNA2_/MRDRNA2_78689_c0~~gnl/MRDRNA2_/MRDRNA2_78689_c0_seq1.p1  ORF type:complete len:924 (-),score=236.66 gnl/MRDRNA2_/MRDRNA2_78689_c0_seq1:210-2699(-)